MELLPIVLRTKKFSLTHTQVSIRACRCTNSRYRVQYGVNELHV